jgi:hypothetical protein
MFETNVVEKIKTHSLCSPTFQKYAVYEIMWKNDTATQDRDQNLMLDN